MAGNQGEGAILAKRAVLAAIGALAGAAYWYLSEELPLRLADPQAYLAVTAAAFGFFAALMALTGPLRLRVALPVALVAAAPPAALLTWASTRYSTLAELFARPEPVVAYLIVLALPLPYLIAALRPGTSWRDYPTLFGESWSIVMRLAASALFAGIVWIAVFLADELLRLVGIDVIERLLEEDWLPPTFTGLVAGLALAIVNEMRDLISAGLVLRLLRILIPPALLVVGAFTLAIPVQGLARLFGTLSPATTLLAIALVLALLVSTGVDADDEAAPRSGLVRLATRGLALLLPAVALLALEALRQRYEAEGLSPARIGGALAGAVLLLYGVFYALSALTGARWMARIRAVNGLMALLVILVAGLWLTPALDAERLSAEDQLARFEAGRIRAGEIDLWTLQHDWGRAGRRALRRIEVQAGDHPEAELLSEHIALARQAPDRLAFWNVPRDPAALSARAELKEMMPVMPPEAAGQFDRYVLPWYAGSMASFLEGCRDRTDTGRPGCVLVVHDLVPDNPGNEAILFYKSFGLLRGEVIVPEPVFRRADAAEVFSIPPPDFDETDRLIEQLQDGGFTAGPARVNAITIGERQFTVPF
ncbi:MAG: DUF4153 domain-containing protein [Paracoccaceae bacterium]|nr:DUF4153 domain-containing protein [Paracoccaceae bacterium]